MNDERTGRHAKIRRRGERWYWEVVATRGNLPDEEVDASPAPGYSSQSGAIAGLKHEHPDVDWEVEDASDSTSTDEA